MNVLTILLWIQLLNPDTLYFTHETLSLESNSGYLQLTWEGSYESNNFVLEQSTDKSFESIKTIYKGPDRASFISGLKDGTYYYRIGDGQGNWSQTLDLTVKHQSLSLAYLLFIVGFVVFAITVFVIIKGVQSTNNKQ